jgi:hypothetical protein
MSVSDSAVAQKEGLCIAKCSVRAFWCHKTRKFLELEEKLFKYLKKIWYNSSAVSHEMLQLRACLYSAIAECLGKRIQS